ncbi:MAG: hypothetical protein FWD63_00440 [Propionibacteriaceae bacterium]|nr:hypothetical protein [Propionibacteriaceae bacterium]
MYNNALASIFFLLACVVAISGLFFVRKSEKTLAGISWLVTSVLMLTCWHAALAAVFGLIRIPINIFSMGLMDVLAGGALWWTIWRRRERQRYEWRIADIIVTAGLLVFTAVFFALRTGGTKFTIHYTTIDPAAWLIASVDVVKTQTVHGMFYQSLTNGLLIGALSPLTTPDYYYRIFIFSGGLFLFIAGLAFYATLRRYAKTKLTFAIIVAVTFLYVIGYPLNATLWGFVWLGMGVILITHITFLADSMIAGDIGKWQSAVVLMCASLALIICYAMFAPVVFLSLGLLVLAKYRTYRLFSKDSIMVGLAIFLIPALIGIVYMFGGVFTDGITLTGAISAEGGCYRDLFSNFVPFAPLAVFGFYKLARARQINIHIFMLPALLIFMLGLFAGGMLGKVSSYYYFKNYNMLWFVVIYLAAVGVMKIANRETAILLTTFATTWLLIFALSGSGIEHQIQTRNELFDPSPKATEMNDLFTWNRRELMTPGEMNPEETALYHYVYNNYVKEGVPTVPIVCYWASAYWYQAISSQRIDDSFIASYRDPDTVMTMVKQSTSEYILVMTDEYDPTYQANKAFFDALPRVFSTTAGYVARLH